MTNERAVEAAEQTAPEVGGVEPVAFDMWWRASKYQQVVYLGSGHRQIALDGWNAALTAQAEEIERLRLRADNLQARLTARAKDMRRIRERLAEVHDNIEDEGDRVYFGSTNDADAFRAAWQKLDAWAWDDIMTDGKLPDIFEVSRQAHARAERAEAELAAAKARLEKAGEEKDVRSWTVYDWEYTDPATGRWNYARTPERAAALAAQGVSLTAVYTPYDARYQAGE